MHDADPRPGCTLPTPHSTHAVDALNADAFAS
jgi:hypothetical protein